MLLRSVQVTGLMRNGERTAAVTARGPNGEVTLTAKLVIGADGHDSPVRAAAGHSPIGPAAAMDVLWFHLPKSPGEQRPFIQAVAGMFITINRPGFATARATIISREAHSANCALASLRLSRSHCHVVDQSGSRILEMLDEKLRGALPVCVADRIENHTVLA